MVSYTHNYTYIFLKTLINVNVDIDECMASMDLCHPNANCTNTPGSYTCACNQGYSGDGTACEGLN